MLTQQMVSKLSAKRIVRLQYKARDFAIRSGISYVGTGWERAVPRMARRGQLLLLVALATFISVRASVLPIEEIFVPTGKHAYL